MEHRISSIQATVRMELATLLIQHWFTRDSSMTSKQISAPNTPRKNSSRGGSPAGGAAADPSSSVLQPDCIRELDDASKHLLLAVEDQYAWSASQTSQDFEDVGTNIAGCGAGGLVNSTAISRLDHTLLSHFLSLLSHSRARLTLSRAAIVQYDQEHCSPRGVQGGVMMFAASVYCPTDVRKMMTRISHYLTCEDPLLSQRSAASLALLRASWGLLHAAGEVGPTLDSMFGRESRGGSVVGGAEGGAEAARAGVHPASSSHPGTATNPRLKIARRQTRVQLRNSLLNEYDAIVMLYRQRLDEATAAAAPTGGEAAPVVVDSPAAVLVEKLLQTLKGELQAHSDREE